MSYRPSCIGCCCDCDSRSVFTSCQHFLCERCTQNLNRNGSQFCPKCKHSCTVIPLGDSKFPKNLRDRIVRNPLSGLKETMSILDFQYRQQSDALSRSKEIIGQLQNALRDGSSQISKLRNDNRRLEDDLSSLQNKFERSERSHTEKIDFLSKKIRALEYEKRSHASPLPSPRNGQSHSYHPSPRSYAHENSPMSFSTHVIPGMTVDKHQEISTFEQIAAPREARTPFRDPSFPPISQYSLQASRLKPAHDALFDRREQNHRHAPQTRSINNGNANNFNGSYMPQSGQSRLSTSRDRRELPGLLPE